MRQKIYGWTNLVIGVIFFGFFSFVLCQGVIGLASNPGGFSVTNSVLVLIIGILGVVEGVRVFIRGFKFIKKGKSV